MKHLLRVRHLCRLDLSQTLGSCLREEMSQATYMLQLTALDRRQDPADCTVLRLPRSWPMARSSRQFAPECSMQVPIGRNGT